MLVLTRKKEEKLYIGNDITLTVLKIKGNSVQIGVEAPRHVRVLRSELALAQPAGDADSGEDEQPCDAPPASEPAAGLNRLRQLAARAQQNQAASAGAFQL